ncbi:hypothetical protein TR2A62_2798 [Thalassobium sp. R2A62]|nr:hypothetical protein TR2A62_2798 [Thalassobium sp. R2A62]
MRDKTVIRFWHFADAAFPCRCGTLIAALRLMSPDRPLEASLRREIQSALSLRPRSTIEDVDETDFG